jgi:hypothetical protein
VRRRGRIRRVVSQSPKNEIAARSTVVKKVWVTPAGVSCDHIGGGTDHRERLRCRFRCHRLPVPYRSAALPTGCMRTCITFSNVSRLGSAVASRNGLTSSATLSQAASRWRTRLYLFLHREYFVSLRRKTQRLRACMPTQVRLLLQHSGPRMSCQAAANHAKWRRPP